MKGKQMEESFGDFKKKIFKIHEHVLIHTL